MKKTKVVTLAGLEVGVIIAKIQHIEILLKAGIGAISQKIKGVRLKLQGSQKKVLLALFLSALFTLTASAQKAVVLDALSKHGIDAGVLNPDCFQQPEGYGFNLQQTTIAGGKEKVIDAKFDPSAPEGEQWTVVAIDGKSPSKGDINSFRKNQAKPTSSNNDEASYRIEKEAADYLVVSSKLDAASVSKDAPFMKDCRSYMTINLKTKRVEQVQTLNEKSVKIKVLNVEKLDIITKYKWDEQAKHYLTTSQNLNIQGKFLGQPVPVQTSSEYSNYIKK